MALPTKTNLETLDYSYLGQPFCHVAAKAVVVLAGMDVTYLGQPFVSNEGAAASSGYTTQLIMC